MNSMVGNRKTFILAFIFLSCSVFILLFSCEEAGIGDTGTGDDEGDTSELENLITGGWEWSINELNYYLAIESGGEAYLWEYIEEEDPSEASRTIDYDDCSLQNVKKGTYEGDGETLIFTWTAEGILDSTGLALTDWLDLENSETDRISYTVTTNDEAVLTLEDGTVLSRTTYEPSIIDPQRTYCYMEITDGSGNVETVTEIDSFSLDQYDFRLEESTDEDYPAIVVELCFIVRWNDSTDFIQIETSQLWDDGSFDPYNLSLNLPFWTYYYSRNVDDSHGGSFSQTGYMGFDIYGDASYFYALDADPNEAAMGGSYILEYLTESEMKGSFEVDFYNYQVPTDSRHVKGSFRLNENDTNIYWTTIR